MLEGPFVQIPHDVVIPGVLAVGDLPELAAAVAPRPLRLDATVDGQNRRCTEQTVRRIYAPAIAEYRRQNSLGQLNLHRSDPSATAWLLSQLKP